MTVPYSQLCPADIIGSNLNGEVKHNLGTFHELMECFMNSGAKPPAGRWHLGWWVGRSPPSLPYTTSQSRFV